MSSGESEGINFSDSKSLIPRLGLKLNCLMALFIAVLRALTFSSSSSVWRFDFAVARFSLSFVPMSNLNSSMFFFDPSTASVASLSFESLFL